MVDLRRSGEGARLLPPEDRYAGIQISDRAADPSSRGWSSAPEPEGF